MYDIARVHMGTRQQAYASYYDKRVLDDTLNVNNEVFVYLPRNKRVQLAKKWDGPYKVVDADHPVYKVKLNGKTGMQDKVFTRDKLKRVPTGFVQDVQTEGSLNKEALTEHLQTEEEEDLLPFSNDSSNSEDDEEVEVPRRVCIYIYKLLLAQSRYVVMHISIISFILRGEGLL